MRKMSSVWRDGRSGLPRTASERAIVSARDTLSGGCHLPSFGAMFIVLSSVEPAMQSVMSRAQRLRRSVLHRIRDMKVVKSTVRSGTLGHQARHWLRRAAVGKHLRRECRVLDAQVVLE